MKSVIPFTKELEFNTKVSEITSISLERDYELTSASLEGNLYITGEYKSHEISVNVIPFSFKIPFSIAIDKKVDPQTLSLEISDFAYDTIKDNKIKVHVELELSFEEQSNVEEEVFDEKESEEIMELMTSERNIIDEEEINQIASTEEKLVETIESQEITLDNKIEENISSPKDNEYMTYHIHILKEGETLESLCTMYKVTGEYLSEYNDIANLGTGDKILIPLENE